VVSDGNDVVVIFILVGKIAKNFFGSSTHNYLCDKGFVDCIPPNMIVKLNKVKIFQHGFGAFRSVVNHCDIIITNVFYENMTAEVPHLPAELDLHAIDVALADSAAQSSYKASSSLDSTTHAPIAPSRADAAFLQQPQLLPMQPASCHQYSAITSKKTATLRR
jgi:replication factor A1